MNGLKFSDRLKLAARALVSPFSQEGAQAAHNLLGGILSTTRGSLPDRSTAELLQTFNTSPWVRACAGRVADAMAATEWKLYVATNKSGQARNDVKHIQKAGKATRRKELKALKVHGELREVQEHLMLDMLSNGNLYSTGRDTLWLTSVWFDIVGDVFLIKERNKMGVPSSLWGVPPHWVAETPTPQSPFFRMARGAWQQYIPASEVLWIQNPNPVDPYGRGTGLGKAIDDEIALDEYAAKHCHDDQTECLTRRGWVNGLSLTMQDEIATWNHENSTIEFHKPSDIINAPYSGPMHYWDGERVDAAVTPNHRLWVEQKQTPGKGRARTHQGHTWEFAKSEEVLKKPGRVIHWRSTGWYDGEQDTITIPAQPRMTKRKPNSRGGGRPPMFGVNEEVSFKAYDFARFLGYYISEGSPDRAALQVCQTEGRHVEDIRASLRVFPSEWVKERAVSFKGKQRYKWHVRHLGLAEWAKKECGLGAYHKRIPNEAFEWPMAAQRELLAGLMNGDGHRPRASFGSYDTRSEKLADDVQRLCVNLGYASNIRIYKNRGALNYSVRIRFNRVKENIGKQAAWVTEKPYDGRIWCVTVPNEKFISRRNGCVMIGGNSAAFFKNSARPDVIVMPKDGGQFSDVEQARFQQFWNDQLQGFWRGFKPLFMKTPIEVKTLEQNFRNMQVKELRDQERDTIIQTWGVPPELFGIVHSSNRSTIDLAPFIFATYVLVPRLERLRDTLQYRLLTEYGDNLILDYVSPVPQDRLFQQSVMLGKPEAFYANEFRELAGLEPEDELDDVLMSGSGSPAAPSVEPGNDSTDANEPTDQLDLEAELDAEEAKQLDRLLLKMARKARA